MSLRETNKAKRRDAIVSATRELFRETSADLVSADRIAERAGVSTATVYNLVGRREEVLGAVLAHLFVDIGARIEAANEPDPILRGEAVVRLSVEDFIADADVYRSVVHELSGRAAQHVAHHVSPKPVNLQIAAMQAAKEEGRLAAWTDPTAVGWQIFTSNNGALFAWAGRLSSDAAFRGQTLHGFWTAIAAFGSRQEIARARYGKNSPVLRNIVIFIRYALIMTLVHVVYQVHGHIIQFAYAVI